MKRTFMTVVAAGLLAAAASAVSAAPANLGPANVGHSAFGGGSDIIQVHGNHRSCRRGPGGWHRHNRFGERRPCRRWDGRGRRPDACVKLGPIWYCDY